MGSQQELHPGRGHGLPTHEDFRFLCGSIWLWVYLGDIPANDDDDRRYGDPLDGAFHPLLDDLVRRICKGHVFFEFVGHCFG